MKLYSEKTLVRQDVNSHGAPGSMEVDDQHEMHAPSEVAWRRLYGRARYIHEHLTTRSPGQPNWALSLKKRENQRLNAGYKMWFAEGARILGWASWDDIAKWTIVRVLPDKCWIVKQGQGWNEITV